MFKKDVENEFTAMVSKYMDEGYHLDINSMSGMQKEMAKVMLCKDTTVIAVYVYVNYDCGEESFNIRAEKFTRKIENKISSMHEILWLGHGEVLEEKKFFTVDEKYFMNEEEIKEAHKKHSERVARLDSMEVFRGRKYIDITSDKAKRIVLPFIRKHYKCSSVRENEINSIYKEIDLKSSEVHYYISVRGRRYTLA